MICQIIGHSYVPNIGKIDYESHAIGRESTRKETKYYNGQFCTRCAAIKNEKVESEN